MPIPNTTPTLFLLSLCLKPSVYLVNSACLYSLSFVTYFSQLQTRAQSRYIIGHLRSYTSHSTIGQCSLYNESHTAISLVLYTVDKGLNGQNSMAETSCNQLSLILLCICSQSVCPISTMHTMNLYGSIENMHSIDRCMHAFT